MYNKKRNIVFVGILIALIAVGAYFMYIKEVEEPEQKDDMTLSAEELDNLDEEQRKEQEELMAEREAYEKRCLEIDMDERDYREGVYGPTMNKDFVKEETLFTSIYDMVEYEFLDYEELDNLTPYMEQACQNIEAGKALKECYEFEKYISRGYLSETGELLPYKRVSYMLDGDGNKVGEDIVDEASRLVAVKITVRYKNLSAKENCIYNKKLHDLNSFIYIGEELQHISSVYRRNELFELASPVYTTMAERYPVTKDATFGTSVASNNIILQPYEEYIGELIYIVPEAELDNMVFMSYLAVNGDSLNYKDIGTNIVFLSYLKEKFAD